MGAEQQAGERDVAVEERAVAEQSGCWRLEPPDYALISPALPYL